VAGGAEGEEAGEPGDSRLAVMDDEQGVRGAAPAQVAGAEENLLAQPGKVPPVPALALVAAPTLPRRIQFLGAAGSEQDPLPEPGTLLAAWPRGQPTRNRADSYCMYAPELRFSD
jgi:hypothetical protein